jgi:hypothetical protein
LTVGGRTDRGEKRNSEGQDGGSIRESLGGSWEWKGEGREREGDGGRGREKEREGGR